MSRDGLRSLSGLRKGRSASSWPNGSANRKVFRINRKKENETESLGEMLSSALTGADTQLGQILREVDRISQGLRSNSPDSETVRVAGHPAIWAALKQTLVERELRHLALTDDLTGIYNRRGFFAAAMHQLKVARRNGEKMLLLFCDVNDLKEINDTYGHPEGDLTLIRAADALEHAFRSSDVLARLGGDEFVVLALGTQSEETILRRMEENLERVNRFESRYRLSFSVGVACLDPQDPCSLGDLLAQADRAMFEQKRMYRKSRKDNNLGASGQREPSVLPPA